MDTLTPVQRRKAMRRVKSKDTSIELTLRKALWKRGIRYRKNYKKLPGKPDIVLTKYKIAVFCDSDFWHGKNWDKLEEQLKRSKNSAYWLQKIKRTIVRDREIDMQLRSNGWIVIRFWEKEISHHTSDCVDAVEEAILERIIRKRIDCKCNENCLESDLRG